MKNSIHFFDLDGTLWSIDTQAWIIKKDQPNKPIIKLKDSELQLILSGVYKEDDISIVYNDNIYWISEKTFNRIKTRYPNIEVEELGLSLIEKKSPEYFENLKIYKDNLRHLIEENDYDFGIISARYSEENDKKLLASLKDELKQIGIEINKFYYVGDYYQSKIRTNVNIRKMNVLLEHMVGFQIDDDKFVPIKQDLYKDIYFYDDEPSNIHFANKVQSMLDGYLENTDEEVYNRILRNIKEKKPILHNNLITNNNLNRFKTTDIKLSEPVKFQIKVNENIKLDSFKNFKKKY